MRPLLTGTCKTARTGCTDILPYRSLKAAEKNDTKTTEAVQYRAFSIGCILHRFHAKKVMVQWDVR